MPGEEELLITPRFRVTRVERTINGQTRAREVIRHPGSVVILPLLDDGRVCLIQNHRITVGETLIELPAGTLEPPEEPATCAERELIEETGFRAKQIRPFLTFFPAPGILDERMHLFVATGLVAGDPHREPNEEIENLIVRWTEAIELIRTGEIRDAKTIVGLLHFDRFR